MISVMSLPALLIGVPTAVAAAPLLTFGYGVFSIVKLVGGA